MTQYYEEKNPYKTPIGVETRYHVVGNPLPSNRGYNEAEAFQDRPIGKITVQHRQFIPNFDEHGVSKDYRYHVEEQASQRGENPYEDYRLPDPKTLFSEIPPMVYSAMSHSSIRHSMPTLLAHAYNQHGRLQADYSLSPHSAPLAQRAIAAGLADAHPLNPMAEESNDIDFQDWKHTTTQADVDDAVRSGDFREIPKEDIHSAKRVVRNMLRPQKDRTTALYGPQFSHPQLPGMEGL